MERLGEKEMHRLEDIGHESLWAYNEVREHFNVGGL